MPNSPANHSKGDNYFGTAKQGKYACTSAALKLGAHAAKKSALGKGTAAGAAATEAPAGGKTKHKKHQRAAPAPSPA